MKIDFTERVIAGDQRVRLSEVSYSLKQNTLLQRIPSLKSTIFFGLDDERRPTAQNHTQQGAQLTRQIYTGVESVGGCDRLDEKRAPDHERIVRGKDSRINGEFVPQRSHGRFAGQVRLIKQRVPVRKSNRDDVKHRHATKGYQGVRSAQRVSKSAHA